MTFVDDRYVLSNSELQAIKRCPREWWLAWYRRLSPRTEKLGGVRGTGARLHVALATLYSIEPGDPAAALDVVQREDMVTAQLALDAALSDDARADAVDDIRELRDAFVLEAIMLEGYLEWLAETGADEHLEVIASETYVEAPILFDDDVAIQRFGVPVYLIGKIDARVRHRVTGRRLFIDHKTGDFPRRQTLRLNPQMKHYHVIEWLSTNIYAPNCDGALYNTLRRVKRTRASKPPYYRRDAVDHTPYELQGYHLQLQAGVANILNTTRALDAGGHPLTLVPPTPSRYCEWGCAFYKICPMFDDNSRVEAAVDDLYQVGDPLSYYGGQEKTLDNED